MEQFKKRRRRGIWPENIESMQLCDGDAENMKKLFIIEALRARPWTRKRCQSSGYLLAASREDLQQPTGPQRKPAKTDRYPHGTAYEQVDPPLLRGLWECLV